MPADQIDFAASIGRAEIAGDHHVSEPSQTEVGGFFTASAGAQVNWSVVQRQGLRGYPVEKPNCGVIDAAGKHEWRAASRSQMLDGSGRKLL